MKDVGADQALVGDPATYIVGSFIGLPPVEYLKHVSPGGLLSILVIIPLPPRLYSDIWSLDSGRPSPNRC